MRLIDADEAIINFGFEWDDIPPTIEEFVRFFKKQPTIDAVEVVRCRECDHKTHDGSGRPYCWQLKMYLNKELDFFCKYGERKGGAD